MLPQLRWSQIIGSLLLFALFSNLRVHANPCLSASNCTQCVKASKDCGWCTDPEYKGSVRCDLKTNLESKCSQNHIYEPRTELRVPKQHNVPLGKKQTDGQTITQLEPQQVQVRIKPGDSVEVPFHYEHRKSVGIEVQNFQIMTSSYKGTGVDVEFSIDCNGERKSGTLCPGIQDQQRMNFYVKLTLLECKSIALSISVYGYNTVSAIFVTPLCECECESPRNYERRSSTCRHQGDLSCGQCKCEAGKGGKNCECDLYQHGVSTAEQLEDKCRLEPGAPVCSGAGLCNCGRCQCDSSIVQGEFCECDNTKCPVDSNGQLCSGQGECRCGKCDCQPGFTGPDCSCKDDPAPCTENGLVCSGNGACECGRCACNVGFTGANCAIEQSSAEWNNNVSEGEILPSADNDEPSADEQHGHVADGQKDSASGAHSILSLTVLLIAAQFVRQI